MTSVLTRMIARALLVPTLVVAAAILVKGYTDVGDGFSAGVVIASGVMLQYLAFGRERVEQALPIRHATRLAVAGLTLVLVVLVAPLVVGEQPLEHWPPADEKPVHVGSLELITAVAFDIGVAMVVVGAIVTIMASLIAADPEPEA